MQVLCSPLGVSPAALRALKANPTYTPSGMRPPPGAGLQRLPVLQEDKGQPAEDPEQEAAHGRVWGNSREGGGIWRPVPPAGHVSLGQLCY